MKLRRITALFIAACFLLSGCTDSNNKNDMGSQSNAGEQVYFAKGDQWLATYSIFKVKASLFDSIYIQNIGENREAKIGKITYSLIGAEGFKSESSYPLALQGVRSYQVSSEYNADLLTIKPNTDGEFVLTIHYQGKEEILRLSPVGEGKEN